MFGGFKFGEGANITEEDIRKSYEPGGFNDGRDMEADKQELDKEIQKKEQEIEDFDEEIRNLEELKTEMEIEKSKLIEERK